MFRSSSADPAKLKKLTNILLRMPLLQLRDAMNLAKYSDEEIADVAFRRFLQRALPGGSLKAFKAQTAGVVLPPPDRTQRRQKRAIELPPPRTPPPR